MSNNHSTAEGEPLHQYAVQAGRLRPQAPPGPDAATLLAVLAKLRDRLTAIPALIAEDTADHPLTDCEVAEWNARVEALEGFAADVALMLKDANPRARVVVLPEPFTDRVDVKHWHLSFGSVVSTARFVSFSGSRLDDMTHAEAAEAGAKLIAASAAEFAGGAQ